MDTDLANRALEVTRHSSTAWGFTAISVGDFVNRFGTAISVGGFVNRFGELGRGSTCRGLERVTSTRLRISGVKRLSTHCLLGEGELCRCASAIDLSNQCFSSGSSLLTNSWRNWTFEPEGIMIRHLHGAWTVTTRFFRDCYQARWTVHPGSWRSFL